MPRALLLLAFVLLTVACQQPHRGPLQAAPDSAGDLVYAGDDRGRVHAVTPDGKRRWTYDFGAALAAGTPGATPDVALLEIATDSTGVLVALYRSETGPTTGTTYLAAVGPDGGERWHAAIGQPADSARPMAVGRDVYVSGEDGALHAYALADGSPLWSVLVSGSAPGSPHVGGDATVFVRGANGRVHAVSPDGSMRWTFDPAS